MTDPFETLVLSRARLAQKVEAILARDPRIAGWPRMEVSGEPAQPELEVTLRLNLREPESGAIRVDDFESTLRRALPELAAVRVNLAWADSLIGC